MTSFILNTYDNAMKITIDNADKNFIIFNLDGTLLII